MPGLTPDQLRAVEASGDVLVLAGAGTGKTSTLVERCVRRVLDPQHPVSLEEVLLVTFTEAAAGEMRRRIRQRLEESVPGAPDQTWLREQLALVDSARISTLHSLCLRLVRDHFVELALDPDFTVMDEAQRVIIRDEVLTGMLEGHYAGSGENNRAVQELVLAYGGANDEPIRRLVAAAHDFFCTLPEPERWLAREEARWGAVDPAPWRDWLTEGLAAWAREWAEELAEFPRENLKANDCLEALRDSGGVSCAGGPRALLQRLQALDSEWPPKKKGAWRKPLASLFEETAFLASLLPPEASTGSGQGEGKTGQVDPLLEDWSRVRPSMRALVGLTREFGSAFAAAKRELAMVDFHDLEQFALRLLWDPAPGAPTPLALELRRELRFVFVDEYQDINAAQDRIVAALSREGSAANRFLVGDVKQSIYRFRLANPQIFQAYAEGWGRADSGAAAVALTENFRSHEALLHFVNALFPRCMRREVGGVEYDAGARLRFGDPVSRRLLAWEPAAPDSGGATHHNPGERDGSSGAPRAVSDPGDEARVEVHLCMTDHAAAGTGHGGEEEPSEDLGALDRTSAEEEAALAAARLRQLRDARFPVWSASQRAFRPVAWRDMVILLRSPRHKAEAYAKLFERAGIPLLATRRGLYDALEVSDLLSLLSILDNPLQDIPLLAVLRSPLVGLAVADLAAIRLGQRSGAFWGALRWFHRQGATPSSAAPALAGEQLEARAQTWATVDRFLGRYARWRTLARRAALSRCLEAVLDETYYEAGLELQPRGVQRRANVQRLFALTRQFDRFQRQGLFRFLKFVEAQRAGEFEPEPAVTEAQDAVSLMSIHQSKGLEFPVVVVPDLAKPFNLDDARSAVLLDQELGLCPLVRLAGRARTYASLPHWLAARRLRRETLGEEIRLLYVAATRARDKLILIGTLSASRANTGWPSGGPARLTTRQLIEVRSSLDWLGRLMPQLTGDEHWLQRSSGQRGFLSWRRHDDRVPLPPTVAPEGAAPASNPDAVTTARLGQRLGWEYPHRAATRETAKTSVTALRCRVTDESDQESRRWFQSEPEPAGSRNGPDDPGERLTPAERGTAHHRFLESVALDALTQPAELLLEADRLVREAVISAAERAVLDLEAVAAFGRSALGQRVVAEAEWVKREWEFTARLAPRDFEALAIPVTPGLGADEFLVVQGVVDLAVIRPEGIWILDFKTDQLGAQECASRADHYAPQLRLYALALSRIHGGPVSEAWLYFLSVGRAERVSLWDWDAGSV